MIEQHYREKLLVILTVLLLEYVVCLCLQICVVEELVGTKNLFQLKHKKSIFCKWCMTNG